MQKDKHSLHWPTKQRLDWSLLCSIPDVCEDEMKLGISPILGKSKSIFIARSCDHARCFQRPQVAMNLQNGKHFFYFWHNELPRYTYLNRLFLVWRLVKERILVRMSTKSPTNPLLLYGLDTWYSFTNLLSIRHIIPAMLAIRESLPTFIIDFELFF